MININPNKKLEDIFTQEPITKEKISYDDENNNNLKIKNDLNNDILEDNQTDNPILDINNLKNETKSNEILKIMFYIDRDIYTKTKNYSITKECSILQTILGIINSISNDFDKIFHIKNNSLFNENIFRNRNDKKIRIAVPLRITKEDFKIFEELMHKYNIKNRSKFLENILIYYYNNKF